MTSGFDEAEHRPLFVEPRTLGEVLDELLSADLHLGHLNVLAAGKQFTAVDLALRRILNGSIPDGFKLGKRC